MGRFLYCVSFLSSLMEHGLEGPIYYFLIMNVFFSGTISLSLLFHWIHFGKYCYYKTSYVPRCQWTCGPRSFFARIAITSVFPCSLEAILRREQQPGLCQFAAQVSLESDQHWDYPQEQAHDSRPILRAGDFWPIRENRIRLIEVHTHSSLKNQFPGSPLCVFSEKNNKGEK